MSNKLRVGKRSFVNRGCLFDNEHAQVIIGNNVAVGYRCSFLTINHNMDNPVRRAGKVSGKQIIIEDGVWIGGNVTILPGVVIGKGSVIAAGSVVTHDVEPNTLYGGVPAIIIRKLDCTQII